MPLQLFNIIFIVPLVFYLKNLGPVIITSLSEETLHCTEETYFINSIVSVDAFSICKS